MCTSIALRVCGVCFHRCSPSVCSQSWSKTIKNHSQLIQNNWFAIQAISKTCVWWYVSNTQMPIWTWRHGSVQNLQAGHTTSIGGLWICQRNIDQKKVVVCWKEHEKYCPWLCRCTPLNKSLPFRHEISFPCLLLNVLGSWAARVVTRVQWQLDRRSHPNNPSH